MLRIAKRESRSPSCLSWSTFFASEYRENTRTSNDKGARGRTEWAAAPSSWARRRRFDDFRPPAPWPVEAAPHVPGRH